MLGAGMQVCGCGVGFLEGCRYICRICFICRACCGGGGIKFVALEIDARERDFGRDAGVFGFGQGGAGCCCVAEGG